MKPFIQTVLQRKVSLEKAYETNGDDDDDDEDNNVVEQLKQQQHQRHHHQSSLGVAAAVEQPSLSNHDAHIKQSFVKPPTIGKLDLKQFDNITNAIKKLNVQPINAALDKQNSIQSSSSKKLPLLPPPSFQEKLKLKKKSKSDKETKQEKNKEKEWFNERTTTSAENTQFQSKHPTPNYNSKQALVSSNNNIIKKADNSNLKVQQQQNLPTHDEDDGKSPFFGKQQPPPTLPSQRQLPAIPKKDIEPSQIPIQPPVLDRKGHPQPAPRTTTSTKPFTNPVFACQPPKKTFPGRQNHGIAVASPQLPSKSFNEELASKDDTFKPSSASFNSVSNAIQKFREKQVSLDSDLSPISQRLIKNNANYKVSELSSPFKVHGDHLNLRASNNVFQSSEGFKRFEHNDLLATRGDTIRQLNEILANKRGLIRQSSDMHTRKGSYELTNKIGSLTLKKEEKDKKDKKLSKDDQKQEKRRLKEEEKQRKLEKKIASKKTKSSSTDRYSLFDEDGLPKFIKRCVNFIEHEGLDVEGIYRVPGNRAHVDAFFQKFDDDPNMTILESDIPVNAVATALKEFLSKKTGPIIPLNMMNEFTDIASISDEESRLFAIKRLVHRLPVFNYKLLKFVFAHFVKVTKHFSMNSMDSKNLAICWWPTILPIHFTDMVMFEQMRPHLETSTQTLIDKYDMIFDTNEPQNRPR